MDGWMDGWMDEWVGGRMDKRTDGWMNRQMNGKTGGWMDGWMNLMKFETSSFGSSSGREVIRNLEVKFVHMGHRKVNYKT